MFSALVQAGDDDIDPMAVVQVQQDIHTMHAQLDALRLLQAAARKHHDHACVLSYVPQQSSCGQAQPPPPPAPPSGIRSIRRSSRNLVTPRLS